MSRKAKQNLRDRLRRLKHQPASASYAAKFQEALDNGVDPTKRWAFPTPVSDADVSMEARRERKRLQSKKDRAAKKQREEEKTAEATRKALEDTTGAQNRTARRDVAKWRKILGDDDGRWTRFCHQVMKSPDMREVVLAVAREIDPVYRRASIRPSEGGEGIRGVGCARAGEV